jgi:hypothetical protein
MALAGVVALRGRQRSWVAVACSLLVLSRLWLRVGRGAALAKASTVGPGGILWLRCCAVNTSGMLAVLGDRALDGGCEAYLAGGATTAAVVAVTAAAVVAYISPLDVLSHKIPGQAGRKTVELAVRSSIATANAATFIQHECRRHTFPCVRVRVRAALSPTSALTGANVAACLNVGVVDDTVMTRHWLAGRFPPLLVKSVALIWLHVTPMLLVAIVVRAQHALLNHPP